MTSTVAGNITGLDEFRFAHGFYRDGLIADAMLNRPASLVINTDGSIYFADTANNAIRAIISGRVYTLSGNGIAGFADGHISEALFNQPSGLVFDADGNLLVADSGNHVIRKISVDGYVTTVAGIPMQAGYADGEDALFNSPMGIVIDETGTIFVADTGNHIIRSITDGLVATIAGTYTLPDDLDFDVTYDDFEWDNYPIGGFADGYNARFSLPTGLALWHDYLIIADRANHRIRAIAPNGYTFTLAGGEYPGHIDGADSAFHLPTDVFVIDDVLFISDMGNNVIRKINLSQMRGE
jgi:hypothetical protein